MTKGLNGRVIVLARDRGSHLGQQLLAREKRCGQRGSGRHAVEVRPMGRRDAKDGAEAEGTGTGLRVLDLG